MARIEIPWRCDGCGRQKAETNHWFLLFPIAVGKGVGMVVAAWSEPEASGPNVQHLCGESCLHAAITKKLGGKDAFPIRAATASCDRT